jgi:two-component system, response regulator / RNA-binding antiterminator
LASASSAAGSQVLHHLRSKVYTSRWRIPNPQASSGLPETEHRLQVLIANEQDERFETITAIVEALGHEIVARGFEIGDVGALSRSSGAEVALVGLGVDDRHALDQISAIVHEAACPVIALLDVADPSYVEEAAKRGVFAYVVIDGADTDELRSAIDITLRRYAEFQNLQGAFGRRAIIEQAKGILMERNGIDADAAFAILKSHSQATGERLFEVAQALTQTHRLLAGSAPGESAGPGPPGAA